MVIEEGKAIWITFIVFGNFKIAFDGDSQLKKQETPQLKSLEASPVESTTEPPNPTCLIY
jgi:hypothetical protein